MAKTKQKPVITEEFLTRVNRLANQVTRADKHAQSAILLALFKVESTRKLAEQALTGILEGKGFRIARIDLAQNENSDVIRLLLQIQNDAPDVVFYVYHLHAGGQSALNSLNIRRELLVENAIKVIFWLEESELQWLAFGASDFWAFRNRVVEFLELPEEEAFQQIIQRFFADVKYVSHEELLAKIHLRKDLLSSLSEEATDARARMNFELGTLLSHNGEHSKAKKHLEQALEGFAKAKQNGGCAAALHQLGMIAQEQGNYKEARRLYQRSLTLEERSGNQLGIATTLNQLGVVDQQQGKYEEARRLYEQSLEIVRTLGYQKGIAANLHQLGNLSYFARDFQEARRLYEQSLQIERQLGDLDGISATLHQLGVLAQIQGDLEEARKFYSQSLEIAQKLGYQLGIAATLHQLGKIAQDQDNIAEARKLYEQSLNIKLKLKDQVGTANTLAQMALLESTLGNLEQALVLMHQAEDILSDLGSPALAISKQLREKLEEALIPEKKQPQVSERRR